jgi:NADPH:quinone reductase-like Zn-dependent oxidoreductase
MKAIIYTKYGPPDVLQLKEVEKPAPKEDEVLIRIYATTVTTAGLASRTGDPFIARIFSPELGLAGPKNPILGVELAGEIESVGVDVKLFKEGDKVFGEPGSGAYAEYICLPEDGLLAIKPANMTYDIIFDTVGKSSFSRCKSSLKQRGFHLSPVPTPTLMLQVLWTSMVGSKKAMFAATGLRPLSEKTEDLLFLKELIEAGKIKSVIDRRYPLEQIAEAQRYVDKGHKKGNVVIIVEHSSDT